MARLLRPDGSPIIMPEELDRRRALSNAMILRGGSSAPIRHWTQCAARVANTLVGLMGRDRAGKEEARGRSEAADQFRKAVSSYGGGGSAPDVQGFAPDRPTPTDGITPTPLAPATPYRGSDTEQLRDSDPYMTANTVQGMRTPDAQQPAMADPRIAQRQNSVAGIESAGEENPYAALGPVTKTGDRAYGKYQVMGNNIPEWTQAALGRAMSKEEFLASKEAQDATFNHRFGGYVAKYGEGRAARAWFAGEEGMKSNPSDQLGTSTNEYENRFTTAMGPGGQPQPTQVASANPADAGLARSPEQSSPLPPQGAPQAEPEPARQQIAQAMTQPSQPYQQQGRPGLNSLMEAYSNPYLGKGQRAVLDALLKQHFKGPDKPGAAEAGYNIHVRQARENGEQPMRWMEYQQAIKKAGAQNIRINTAPGTEFGPNSKDTMRFFNKKTGEWEIKDLKGGVGYKKGKMAERKAVGRLAGLRRAGGTVVQDLQRGLDMFDEMNQGKGVAGANMRLFNAAVPGTSEYNVEGFIQSALSNVGLDKLQDMRENSPTGGALGQVPIQQQKRLEQVLGSLKLGQHPDVLKANMKRVINIYIDIMYGTQGERDFAVSEGKLSPAESSEIAGWYYELPFDKLGRRRKVKTPEIRER